MNIQVTLYSTNCFLLFYQKKKKCFLLKPISQLRQKYSMKWDKLSNHVLIAPKPKMNTKIHFTFQRTKFLRLCQFSYVVILYSSLWISPKSTTKEFWCITCRYNKYHKKLTILSDLCRQPWLWNKKITLHHVQAQYTLQNVATCFIKFTKWTI